MKKKYDFLIVGSGWYGSVCARELTDKGYKCLVIDKRNHIGGNCYTEKVEGINVHKYGAHIFHTSNKEVWDYVNKYTEFNNYRHHVIANYNHIYVDWWESPCMRYLLEYGDLKTQVKNNYLEKFTFEKYGDEQPKMNDLLDYDLIITSDLFNQGSNDRWTLKEGANYLYIQKK